MDAYPEEYFAASNPLLVLSGLGLPKDESKLPPYPLLDNGTLVTSDVPPVTSTVGLQLLQCFHASAAPDTWVGTSRVGGRLPNSATYKVVVAGRTYVLPPRKANPPGASAPSSPLPDSAPRSGILSPSTPTGRILHSPLSPLTPGSPLYPDGVFTHIWLRKHLSLLPCAFISFFELFSSAATAVAFSSTAEEIAADSALIGSIKEMKRQFAADTRKVKFTVVLIATKTNLEAPTLEDRFSLIRRSTQLDSKSSLFFLPAGSSPVELEAFVKSIEMALAPSSIEYYTELSKRARKKRHRSSIPPPTLPPTTTSHSLSNIGWTVRYEMKLATYAEFRNETDIAIRHYETAYEGLMEVFETTNSWSARWGDGRLISDAIAARMIRCHIYMEASTAAARRWESHKRRTGEMLDRKGLGKLTYGYAAWEARWSEMMATIVFKSGILDWDQRIDRFASSYISPDGNVKVGEKAVGPSEVLYHAGYYWMFASTAARSRRRRAQRLVETEGNEGNIDTYLCPGADDEKSTDHINIIGVLLRRALKEFGTRKQNRIAAKLSMEIAILEMERQKWNEALPLLKSSIQRWRREGWTSIILHEALWRIRECASKSSDGASLLMTDLELLSNALPHRQGWKYDIHNSLAPLKLDADTTISLVTKATDLVPFVSATSTFKSAEVCVGEPAISQIAITSHAHTGSTPVNFSYLKITYEGTVKTVMIHHKSSSESESTADDVTELFDLKGKLQDRDSTIDASKVHYKGETQGSADLTFPPGKIKIFEISTILRETGDARAVSATLGLNGPGFEVEYMIILDDVDETNTHVKNLGGAGNALWWRQTPTGLKKVAMRMENPTALHILPKPPKMEITLVDALPDPLFIDEPVKIHLLVRNDEEDEAVARLRVRILGYPDDVPLIRWDAVDDTPAIEEDPETPYQIGSLAPSTSLTRVFTFPAPPIDADLTLEISSLYHLIADPDTPISKTVIVTNINIRKAFKTKFDFSPAVHPASWPNYFSLSDDDDDLDEEGEEKKDKVVNGMGLVQRWCLKCDIGMLDEGVRGVVVKGLECVVVGSQGGIVCRITEMRDLESVPKELAPKNILEPTFILDITKLSLEDRRASTLDLELLITWSRPIHGSQTPLLPIVTSLPVPRLLIPGSEPRVLCSSSLLPSPSQTPIITLTYTLENPTFHVLTFSLSMEANETFAFAGSKTSSVQLMPLSRFEVRYRIVPLTREEWIRPALKVVDRYYNKQLRIAAVGGAERRGNMGVERGDKSGVAVWAP